MARFGKRVLQVGALSAAGLVAASWAMAPRPTHPVSAAFWQKLSSYRYAHRGLHAIARGIPENSLAAYRAARDAGYGVEFDVHLSADKHLVVIHDSNLSRMCGVARMVEECTLEELQSYRLKHTDERIPTLEEVLDIFAHTNDAPPLIVEIKAVGTNQTEIAHAVAEVLDTYPGPYCVESFDPSVLHWFRMHRPQVVRGQLAENYLRDLASSYLGMPMRLGGTLLLGNAISRPDFVAYRYADLKSFAPWWVQRVLKGRLLTWTVRTPADMLAAEAAGIPVIFEGFEPEPRSSIR